VLASLIVHVPHIVRWRDAAEFYGKAVALAPAFSFAAANRALALYQLHETDASMREMRCELLRRH
jgi:hypothetical protein